MRQETIVRTLYKYDELSDAAKEKAREWFRQGDDFSFHADCVIDDAKEIGKRLGINIDRVYYSGFWSQGDGACFEGHYSHAKDALKSFKQYAPCDTELERIATGLVDLQKQNGYKLTASVKHRGHYYHEHCTLIEVDHETKDVAEDVAEKLRDLLRDFMRWIYRRLESEYEYLYSDDTVAENIRANDYEFLENGKVA